MEVLIFKSHRWMLIVFLLFLEGIFLRSESKAQLRILTYESLLGKHGLAPHLEIRFQELCKKEYPKLSCKLEFVKAQELSGLLGQMRQSARRKKNVAYQMVIGLDDDSYAQALTEKLVAEGKVFDESPYAIMVDTLKVNDSQRPKSWKELVTKFPKSLLVQDPRSSTPGIGWIRSIFEWNLVSTLEAKNLVKRSFPSWTSSYSAFNQGEASFVWSYLSSEAYHRCTGKNNETPRYQALVLEEGYPVQREWLARVLLPQAKSEIFYKNLIGIFEKVLFEDDLIQEKIYTTQWMFPVKKDVSVPECYSKIPKVKRLEKSGSWNASDIQKWIDEWTL